jgi:uncharacterized protein involved in exopolysaccharide biosynthesis
MKRAIQIGVGALLILASPVAFFGGTAITLMTPKLYEGVATVQIQPPEDLDLREDHPVIKEWIRTEAFKMRSKPVLHDVSSALNLSDLWGKTFNADGAPMPGPEVWDLLAQRLKITVPQHLLGIAEVRCYSEDPGEAARIANEVAHAYKMRRLQDERKNLKRLIDAHKKQLDELANNVTQIEDSLKRKVLTPEERTQKEKELRIAKAILIKVREKIKKQAEDFPVPKSPVDIVSPATPPMRPVSPRLYTNFLISLSLAGILLLTGSLFVAKGIKKNKGVQQELGEIRETSSRPSG